MENRQQGIDFEEEHEIDLKQLFLVLCTKWKLILIVALAGLVLGGVYGAVRRGTITVEVPAEETQEEEAEPLVSEWEVYEVQKRLYEERITQNVRLLEDQKNYLKESLRMGIDYRDTSVASAAIYITRDEDFQLQSRDSAGLSITTMRILNSYVSAIYSAPVMETIARKIDTDAIYVRELISASVNEKISAVSISVPAGDDETAERILDELLKAVEDAHSQIVSEYDSHEMSVTRFEIYSGISNGIRDAQNEATRLMDTYNNQIVADKTALSKLEEPKEEEEPVETTTADTEAATTTIPAPFSMRNVVKKAGMGCVAGVFLCVMALAMYYIFSGRMLSAEEMNRRYGLRALTVMTPEKIQGLNLRLARAGRDGTYYRMSAKEQLEVAGANLSVYAPEARELLLVGSIDAARMERVSRTLTDALQGVSVSCAPDINENAVSLQALKTHDDVVLVEQVLSSRYEEIDRELKTLIDWKKNIVGSIVLE